MNLIGSLSDNIMADQNLKKNMETMMLKHIQPELHSPEPYLKMRAIWFFGEFQFFTFSK